MYVYLIGKEGSDNAFKIGYSKNPEERLMSLQTSSEVPLELITKFETEFGYKLETALHNRFSHRKKSSIDGRRLVGEWFALEREDLEMFYETCKTLEKTFKTLKEQNSFVQDRDLF